MNEVKNIRPVEENKSNTLEAFGFIAIGLTMVGQIVINFFPLWGQVLWLVSNVIFLTKAVKQGLGKAEVTRNVCNLALTIGIIAILIFAL